MVHLYNVCREKQPGDIHPAFEQLKRLAAVIDRMNFPPNVAAGIEARGLDPGVPKAIVSPASAKLLREIVAELRRLFAEWGLPPAEGAPART